jgi:hypothetical protein
VLYETEVGRFYYILIFLSLQYSNRAFEVVKPNFELILLPFLAALSTSSDILSNELNEADTGRYEVGASDFRCFLNYFFLTY